MTTTNDPVGTAYSKTGGSPPASWDRRDEGMAPEPKAPPKAKAKAPPEPESESESKSTILLTRHDEHLADLLQRYLVDRLRFNRATNDWYTWRDFYWDNDPAHAFNLIVHYATRLLGATRSTEKRNAILPLFDVRKQKSVLEALSHREAFRLQGDEFDQVAHLLAVHDGIVDLRDGKFSKHGDPLDYVSKRARVAWSPSIPERWQSFVREVMSGDEARAAYLLSALGYSLFGDQREQKFWLFIGKQGGNGKGTLMRTMDWILGEYSDWPNGALYMKPKHGDPDANQGNPALLKLQGIRFLPMSEPGGGQFNDELIKAHTGDDPISARPLYSNQYTSFRPTHTIVIAANEAPRVADVGGAMRDRVRVLSFNESFRGTEREDKDLEKKLKAEGSGILALLVQFARRYHETGHLEPEPADVTEASDQFIEASDSLADFLAEWCVVGHQESATSDRMWDAYRDWVNHDSDRVLLARNDFGVLLGKRFNMRRVGQRKVRTYFGVRPASADVIAEREGDQVSE